MMYLIVRALLSGAIIVAASEIAKRSPAFGALVVSLPLVSLLSMLWLWRDTQNSARIADQAQATFWYILPSLPMFLVLPYMLRHGANFWIAMLTACGLTVLLYFLTVMIAARSGVEL